MQVKPLVMLGIYFKFHKNRTINEEFDFWGVKVGGGRGKGCPDFKNLDKPDTEW